MRDRDKTKKCLIEELNQCRKEVEKLKIETTKNPLTGLFNRRYFAQIISGEISRAQRAKYRIGFLMIDVDKFKRINDILGHQGGDAVLQRIATTLQEGRRDMDTVVRYGEDEFLIILPMIGNGLDLVVHRIEKAMKKWGQNYHDIDFPITLSIGTSTLDPENPEKIEDIIKKADSSMYQVKRSKEGYSSFFESMSAQ